MRKTILAAATALSMAAVPAAAENPAMINSVKDKRADFTAEQQEDYDRIDVEARSEFDGWTRDYQDSYFAWNDDVQDYYWTLDTTQRTNWWYLTDEQRTQLYMMENDMERMTAWDSINSQVAAIQSEEKPEMTTEVNYVSNDVVQDAPIARSQHDGDYPVCTSEMQDHCMNPWAAGMRGPGVDKPLTYYPGDRDNSDNDYGG